MDTPDSQSLFGPILNEVLFSNLKFLMIINMQSIKITEWIAVISIHKFLLIRVWFIENDYLLCLMDDLTGRQLVDENVKKIEVVVAPY